MRKQRSKHMYGDRLSTAEVASILGVSTRTLFRMLATKNIEQPEKDIHSGYFLWRSDEVEQIRQERLRKKS